MVENDTIEKFNIWFVEPIKILKELPDGKAGMVVFIIGLALYERLIRAKLKNLGKLEVSDVEIKNTMSDDLHLTKTEFSVFWDMFRNGMLHQALPKKGRTNYHFNYQFSAYPIFSVYENGQSFVQIDPFKFTDRVINEFLKYPKLFDLSDSYPLPKIIPESADY